MVFEEDIFVLEKFCFGALARILHYCCKLGVKQYELGEGLLKVFNEVYGETAGATKISRLFNCAEGLSRDYTITPAREMSLEDVKAGFSSFVLPLIDENKHQLVILAVKQIILSDDDIKDGTSLGIITKAELRTKASFDFVETVAGLLKYSCFCVSNRSGKNTIDNITPEFVDGFTKDVDSITIEKLVIVPAETIEKTLEPDTFLQAFHEIDAELSLGLKNNNQLRLFRLECDEGEYSYDSLNDFLLDNIGAYVYSRETMKELIEKKKAKSIGIRAIRTMNKNGKPGLSTSGNDLAQMLVYAFLEEVLGAPKIMSKVELSQNNTAYTSNSDSIHFLTLEENGKRTFELVFGAADISLGLQEAVDKAMDKVNAIKSNGKAEKGLVNGALFNKAFDADTADYLKSVLIPNKNLVQRPNMAYGLFLGYSIGVNSDVDHFEEDAATKLEQDVRGCVPYIVQKINALGLKDRSFYVYFLPFNDAVKDKIAIMENLLSTGGDY